MLLMPFCLVRLGVKATLLVGMGAWALRYVLFAFGNAHELLWMLLIGIALHGVCYDFFFVSGQDIHGCQGRDSLQGRCTGLITMATYGVGMLIGFSLAGMVRMPTSKPAFTTGAQSALSGGVRRRGIRGLRAEFQE